MLTSSVLVVFILGSVLIGKNLLLENNDEAWESFKVKFLSFISIFVKIKLI